MSVEHPPIPALPDAPAAAAAGADTPTAPPSAVSAPTTKADKDRDRRRNKVNEMALEIRKLHWPTIGPAQLWLLDGKRGGFAQVPRTLSLLTSVIKDAVKKKTGKSSAAGNTYTVLWLHIYGEGVAKIDNEKDAAFEAGYGGERSVSTFRSHMNVLKDLGFIDYGEGPRGPMQWVLLLNPYQVLQRLNADGLVEKKYLAALLERLSAIGSSNELKDSYHAVE